MNAFTNIILIIGSLVPLSILAYPLYVMIRAFFVRRPVKKWENANVPVSIIIACHNEEQFILRKINSFLQPEEWIEGSEIIVVSNGSTDLTNDLLRTYSSHERINLVYISDRVSKIAAVNKGVSCAKNDVLVFSDCRQIMKPGSVRAMVVNFCDHTVGTVTAELSTSLRRKGIVRKLFNRLARLESSSGSSLNVFGALYAQRRSVYRIIPDNLLFDDLFVAASTLAQGKRLISEKNAVINDVDFNSYYSRNRIERLARGLMLFYTYEFGLVHRMPGEVRMRFLIFKCFKLLLPFAAAILCFGSFFGLIQNHPYLSLGWLFLLAIFLQLRHKLLFVRVLFYLGYGVIRYITGAERTNQWEKIRVSSDLKIHQGQQG